MAADMAVELKEQNVACVSLWPGAVMTENVNDFISQPQDEIVIFFIFMLLSSPLPLPPPPSSLLPPPPSSLLLPPPSSLLPPPHLASVASAEQRREVWCQKNSHLWHYGIGSWGGGGILPYMGWKVMKKPYCQISAFKCKFSGRYKDLYALFTLYKSLWKWLGSNRLRSRPYLDEFFVGVIGA